MMIRKVFLTFDCEDFINARSVCALHIILKLLKRAGLTALFFITGHMAEKISHFPEILDLLKCHQIGYHASSHSVRPTIFEYTDIDDYKQVICVSAERETSHINPFSGAIEGKGGIELLKKLFAGKSIMSFRAPGFCWSPPHLEALHTLGIRFDFSTHISAIPVKYKAMTFYPHPISRLGKLHPRNILQFQSSILKNEVIVLFSHPNGFVNADLWEYIYFKGNPQRSLSVPLQSKASMYIRFLALGLQLMQIWFLKKLGLIEVTPALKEAQVSLDLTKICVQKIYEKSIEWSRNFGYEPRFLRRHFSNYFEECE